MSRHRTLVVNKLKSALRGTRPYAVLRDLRRRYNRLRGRFDAAYMDVNNVCNLRCPFCCNDWAAVGKPIHMDEAVFAKAIELMPLVTDRRFHFSCLFEPTLNPRLIPMLETIPRRMKNKGFFTTNLNTKLTADMLRRLSRCHLHHINVSVESLVPEVYEETRKNGGYERFVRNLEMLGQAFASNPDAPAIYFITTASKLNAKEIPELVRTCATKYGAASHEVRTYLTSDANRAWVEEHGLSREEFNRLEADLAAAGLDNYALIKPPEEDGTRYYAAEQEQRRFLHISADGSVGVGDNEELMPEETFNLLDMPDPRRFFADYLKK